MPRKSKKKPKPKAIGEGCCHRCSEPFNRQTSMGDWTFDPKTGRWTCPRCSSRLRALARFKKTDRKKYLRALTCSCGALDDNYEEVRRHAAGCKVSR